MSSSFINTTLAGLPLKVLPGSPVSASSPSDLGAAHIFLQCKILPPSPSQQRAGAAERPMPQMGAARP